MFKVQKASPICLKVTDRGQAQAFRLQEVGTRGVWSELIPLEHYNTHGQYFAEDDAGYGFYDLVSGETERLEAEYGCSAPEGLVMRRADGRGFEAGRPVHAARNGVPLCGKGLRKAAERLGNVEPYGWVMSFEPITCEVCVAAARRNTAEQQRDAGEAALHPSFRNG